MLRIAFNSYSATGAWLLLRLLKEGHKVDYYLSDKECAMLLEGIIPTPHLINLREGHSGMPDYGRYDLSIFDLTGRERWAEFSAKLCPTIGDGKIHSKLEDKRAFALEIMEESGILVPPYEQFAEVESAKKYITDNDQTYVYKCDGGQEVGTDSTYVSSSAQDMLDHIDKLYEDNKGQPFILQEFIKGTEVSTEGFFNGDDFYLVNSTIECKKFMNDDVGPQTGCAGSLVFCHGLSERALYKETIKKLIPFLKAVGFVGPIDLNTIVTDEGAYGLEFTPRFGYDAIQLLCTMYSGNFGEMLQKIAIGEIPDQSWNSEFCASIRLSIPPYPFEHYTFKSKGQVVEGIEEEDYEHVYMYDVCKTNGHMQTCGTSGYIGCVINNGSGIKEAFGACEDKIKKIKIPGLQYRTDCEKKVSKRYEELLAGGWLR